MRFYDVQGQENTGYVTDRFLRGVLSGVRGLDLAARDEATGLRPTVRDELGAVYCDAATLRGELDADAHDRDRRHRPDAGRAAASSRRSKLAQAINEQLLKTV